MEFEEIVDLWHIALSATLSVVVLFILTKLMGNRQMSQLSMFDYINGITIGSIAAEMSITKGKDLLVPFVAMCIYAIATILISVVTYHSIKLRRILIGKPLILFENGKLYEGNLKKGKLDVNEFLTQCRNSGYFDISKLQTAILESNGKISFIPLSDQRPIMPIDLGMTPQQDRPVANIIIDGIILKENLKFTGNNENWLQKQLVEQKINDIKEVFLATCDNQNTLTVYIKRKEKMTRDVFE